MSDRATKLSPLALFVLLAGPFLSMVDSSVVNVAVPEIAHEFAAPLTSVQWSVSGYLLALAASLPATAYLARRFGAMRVYGISVAAFTITSVLCALAQDVPQLVAARVLQGLAAGPLVPLALSLVFSRSTGRDLPIPAGLVLFLGPALGPTLGGLLIEAWGWPLIFAINAPIGVAALAGVPRLRRQGFTDDVDRSTRFDPVGLVLLTVGVSAVVYGASEAPTRGWLAEAVAPFWLGGAVLVAGYVAWAWRREEPAVDLRLLRHGQSALAVVLCVLVAVALFGVLLLVPVVVQTLQGHSALASGLVLLPQGVVMGLSSAIGMKLTATWLRAAIVVGFLAVGVTSLLLLTVTVTTPLWLTSLIMAGRGLGIGLVIQPLLTAMLAGLPPRELDHANTLFNVGQRIGGSVGVSLLATLFSVRAAHHLGVPATSGNFADVPAALRPVVTEAALTAFQETVWVAAAIAFAGMFLALAVRGSHA